MLKDVIKLNENVKRMLEGWPPRSNAPWYFWVLFDVKALISPFGKCLKKYFSK